MLRLTVDQTFASDEKFPLSFQKSRSVEDVISKYTERRSPLKTFSQSSLKNINIISQANDRGNDLAREQSSNLLQDKKNAEEYN